MALNFRKADFSEMRKLVSDILKGKAKEIKYILLSWMLLKKTIIVSESMNIADEKREPAVQRVNEYG